LRGRFLIKHRNLPGIRKIAENFGSSLWLGVLQDIPNFTVIETFHEFGSSPRIESKAEFLQFSPIILGQHLSNFWQKQCVDHWCSLLEMGLKKKPVIAFGCRLLDPATKFD
jgi:hypothetical protein